jgi:penicillin-binding protein 2
VRRSPDLVSPGRRNVFIIVLTAFMLVITGRLYQLQIAQYHKFSGMAEANRIRIIPIESPRGLIFDRKGEILADNKFQYNLNVIPYELRASEDILKDLSQLLNLPVERIQARINNNFRGRFMPAKIAEDIDFQLLSYVVEHKLELPGVLYSIEPIRSFPAKANLAHVIGYLREVSPDDLHKIKHFGYRAGDLIGWKGIEQQYENILRGHRGYDYVQVDALGREVGEIIHKNETAPRAGNDLYLTIDAEFQAYLESLLEGRKGVIIGLNPDDGAILGLVSKPDYSPNLFSGVIESDSWTSLRDDPGQPLYNRATHGLYPPGSTFKMVAAFAGLQEKIIDTRWSIYCDGYYPLGRRTFHCWKLGGHGWTNLNKAIMGSCNVYFYNLIRKMDIDLWAQYTRLFGFGGLTGIDLPAEEKGLVPGRSFLDRKYGRGRWTEGMKLNLVIGQGDLLVTPLQMARFAAILATRGKLVQPHLGLKYFDRTLGQYVMFTPVEDSITVISKSVWEIIENAMYDVINQPEGTGKLVAVSGLKVYGKTGTAQNPHGNAHSWFLGYARQNAKSMALLVLVEQGGAGGGIASELSHKVLKYWKDYLLN